MRWPPCTKHNGRHLDVAGQCVHVGAPCALRPSRCAECGEPTMRRLDLQTGEVTTIEAGSDAVHRHERPVRVELDADSLAEALVKAGRQAREARQQPEPARADPQPAGPRSAPSEGSRRVLDLET